MKNLFIDLCCLIYYVSSGIQEIPSIARVIKRKSSIDYSLPGVFLNLIAAVAWSIYIYSSEQTIIVKIGTFTDLMTVFVYTFVMLKYHKERNDINESCKEA